MQKMSNNRPCPLIWMKKKMRRANFQKGFDKHKEELTYDGGISLTG